MKTNELKKGARVLLRNGWEADIMDNARGNIRMAKVYGTCTEIGSVYVHDIVAVHKNGDINCKDGWSRCIEYTPAQNKLRQTVANMGGAF